MTVTDGIGETPCSGFRVL